MESWDGRVRAMRKGSLSSFSRPLFLRPPLPRAQTSLDIHAQKGKMTPTTWNQDWGKAVYEATAGPPAAAGPAPLEAVGLRLRRVPHPLRELMFWQEVQVRNRYVVIELRVGLPGLALVSTIIGSNLGQDSLTKLQFSRLGEALPYR